MDTEKDLQYKEETLESETEVKEPLNEDSSPEVEPVFAEDDIQSSEDKKEDSYIEELKLKIEELQKDVEEKENKLLRSQADFDNFRRRTRQDIENIEKYRSQSLALEIIGAVDNFERALQTEVKSDEAQSLLKGMEMIYKSILESLKREGVEPMESVGKEFNPEYHHAVMQDQDDSKEPNTVLEEFQKGYILKDKVIRPAMVKVNQ